jgi:methionine synthase II (cobalamin-independent)
VAIHDGVGETETTGGAAGDADFMVATGTATAIGSLPLSDADEAVDLVLSTLPRLPAAPSLPTEHPVEGMLAQAAWGLRGVEVADDGTLSVSPDELDRHHPYAAEGGAGIVGPPFATLQTFLQAVQGRPGPVKLQVTGPVTLGRALHDGGAPADLAFPVAGAAVRERVEALLAAARHVLPTAPLLVFLDEPGLSGNEHPRFPLSNEAVVQLLSESLAAVELDAVSGVHCCGATDWSLVTQAGPRVLSVPVTASLVSHAGTLGRFLEREGWIAWGAVPTDEPVGESGDGLWRRLSDLWCALVREGCDAGRLRRQALVTPACGLAGHGSSQADHSLRLAAELGRRVLGQAIGVRLQVGA